MVFAAVGPLMLLNTAVEGKSRLRHSPAAETPSLVELKEPNECTGVHQDPWSTGMHEPCCHGLKQQLGKWDGTGRHHYICIAEAQGGPTCEEQWDNMAGVHPGGHWECFTCGNRIAWLQEKRGLDKRQAQQRVADEFFSECGACAESRSGLAIENEGYRLVWADEFNVNGRVDDNRWKSTHSHGDGFGNHELQFYTNRQTNAWVSEGTLKIRAKREDFEGRKYTSARLEVLGRQTGCCHGTGSTVAGRTAVRLISWNTLGTSLDVFMARYTQARTITPLGHRKVVPCTLTCKNGTLTQLSGDQKLSFLLAMTMFIRSSGKSQTMQLCGPSINSFTSS